MAIIFKGEKLVALQMYAMRQKCQAPFMKDFPIKIRQQIIVNIYSWRKGLKFSSF